MAEPRASGKHRSHCAAIPGAPGGETTMALGAIASYLRADEQFKA
jgi:hypothetical protein